MMILQLVVSKMQMLLLLLLLLGILFVSVPTVLSAQTNNDGTTSSSFARKSAQSKNPNVCVEDGRVAATTGSHSGEYICTKDPLSTRLLVDRQYPNTVQYMPQQQQQQLNSQGQHGQHQHHQHPPVPSITNRGVTQRIDGSESEKKAIREILQRMDEYFLQEVFALPDYASVRSNCVNNNELCAFWSSVGECESNRVFMLSNCAAACRFCLLLHTNLA